MGECDIYLMETEQVSKVCASVKVLRLLTPKGRLTGIEEEQKKRNVVMNAFIHNSSTGWLWALICAPNQSPSHHTSDGEYVQLKATDRPHAKVQGLPNIA
jgi:hypothetical protein